MTRERRMAASAFGEPGAAAGGGRARRRRRGGEEVGRGSWVAATRIVERQAEVQIRLLTELGGHCLNLNLSRHQLSLFLF
jgi:hypothetical protein